MRKLNKKIFDKNLISETKQSRIIGSERIHWTLTGGTNNAGAWNSTRDWKTDDIGQKKAEDWCFVIDSIDLNKPIPGGVMKTINTGFTVEGSGPQLHNNPFDSIDNSIV